MRGDGRDRCVVREHPLHVVRIGQERPEGLGHLPDAVERLTDAPVPTGDEPIGVVGPDLAAARGGAARAVERCIEKLEPQIKKYKELHTGKGRARKSRR